MKEKKMRLVTTAEVKEILTQGIEDRDEPINEQKYAREHADRFGRIKAVEADKLVEELMENVPRVKEHLAYKLADILVEHPDDIKVVFARERFSLTEDELTQIIDITKKYIPEE
jgi:DNA-directed RNA polymerase subunit F